MGKHKLPDEAIEHGTQRRYRRGCRCQKCVMNMRAKRKEWRLARTKRPIPADLHGQLNCYVNWGCRCALCTAALQKTYGYSREYQKQNREELNAKRLKYYYEVEKPREAAALKARDEKRRNCK